HCSSKRVWPSPQSHPIPKCQTSWRASKAARLAATSCATATSIYSQSPSWSRDPWGGELIAGRIYGRGVPAMQCGTSASIFTFVYLSRIKERLKGRLTLTAVSDEETFGPRGARYLMGHHPEVHGDALLNGEPSSPLSVKFGEKGLLWIEFRLLTSG